MPISIPRSKHPNIKLRIFEGTLLSHYIFRFFVREFKFCADRKFRSDYAFPHLRLLVEIEGGVFSRGRHVRGKGYLADMEKYNLAAILGWAILRFTPDQAANGYAVQTMVTWHKEKLNQLVNRRE